MPRKTKPIGLAAMTDAAQRKKIASLGGKAAHAQGVAHRFDQEQARKAGRKGGKKTAMDREHMAEIGRRGGLASGKKRNGN